MTYFQSDNGNTINISDDFSLTRACANIFNFQIRGDVSVSFQIDNNSYNRKQLDYYSTLQTPNPAFNKQIFNYVRNGNILSRGYLIVERDDDDYIYLFFIAGNSNWINLITGSLKDLDYEDYALHWQNNVLTTTPANTTGFTFPLVDWSCQGLRNNYTGWNLLVVDSSADYLNRSWTDFFPCFFLASAVQQILKAFNIKLAGDILTDPLYNNLLITPDSGQITRASKFLNARHSIVTNSAVNAFTIAYAKIVFDTIISDGSLLCYDSTNRRYVANKSCTIQIIVNLNLSASSIFTIGIYKNGLLTGTTYVNATASTVIQSRQLFVDVVMGDYLEIYGKASAGSGNILATVSTAEFQPAPIVIGGFAISTVRNTTADTIRASDMLPDIAAMDFIKFVINYFCCIASFDISTSTLTLNSLDNYKLPNAVDWSDFLQLQENNYGVKTAQNNYIRLEEPFDPHLNIYNNINPAGATTAKQSPAFINYGEAVIQGQSQATIYNDLMTIPFGPAVDKFTAADRMLLPWISLIGLTDSDNPVTYQSVTSTGGLATFFNSFLNNPPILPGQILRFFSADSYNGYAVVKTASASSIVCIGVNFTTNNAGSFYVQNANFNTGQSRLLYAVPNTAVTHICTNLASINGNDYTGGTTNYANACLAYYSKPLNTLPISTYKRGVNVGPINGGGTDIPTKGFYFKIISRILNSPYVKAQMLIPEYDFTAFQFGTFIYLKEADEQKYYVVDSIENYKDSKTLCQVNLLLVQ